MSQKLALLQNMSEASEISAWSGVWDTPWGNAVKDILSTDRSGHVQTACSAGGQTARAEEHGLKISVPQDPKLPLKTVPAEVHRRQHRETAPLPPPSPASQSSRNSRSRNVPPNEKRRKGRVGGDGSDSDDDDQRPGHGVGVDRTTGAGQKHSSHQDQFPSQLENELAAAESRRELLAVMADRIKSFTPEWEQAQRESIWLSSLKASSKAGDADDSDYKEMTSKISAYEKRLLDSHLESYLGYIDLDPILRAYKANEAQKSSTRAKIPFPPSRFNMEVENQRQEREARIELSSYLWSSHEDLMIQVDSGQIICRFVEISFNEAPRILKRDFPTSNVRRMGLVPFVPSHHLIVYRVLIKDGVILNAEPVYHKDLVDVGWQFQTPRLADKLKGISRPVGYYWRYRLGTTEKTANRIFRVRMNGCVEGVWR